MDDWMPVAQPGDPICERCHSYKSQHRLANYADGPQVGEGFLVCPTAVYREATGKPGKN